MLSRALVENQEVFENSFRGIGKYLSEEKYRDLCCDESNPIEDDESRYSLGVLLENMNTFIANMDETTRAQFIGDFQKYAFPLVRAIFPELAANSLVSVQPMLGPTSLVFYLDFVYGSDKGSVKKGDTAFSSVARGANNPNYSSPVIQAESLGNAVAAVTAYTCSYTPIVPGSLTVTNGIETFTDDGNGVMISSLPATANGTVDYDAGSLSLDFNAIGAISADYTYDMEAQSADNIPQMDMLLQSAPVIARPRKLRTRWSLEAGFNLRALHGLEAEVELTAAIGSEIRFEIDREIIRDIQRLAGAGSVKWSSGAPANVSYTEHKLTIIDCFVTGNNLIHKATGRAAANWILCGEDVAAVVETLPGFVPNPGVPSGLMKGVVNIGTLQGRWQIFKDPFYNSSNFLMGYKGGSFLEAGYVYAPYVPLYTTPTVVLDDFQGRKGIATQYGKKAINPLFYVTGELKVETAGVDPIPASGVSVGTKGQYGV